MTAQSAEEIRRTLEELFRSQRLAVLATQGQGQPHGSLVAVAATDALRTIIFATTRATRKFANLEADDRVALVVDNRSNRSEDFHAAVAVTVYGRAAEATGGERERLAAVYLAQHPYLAGFVAAPTCALVRVDVSRYSLVSRFQEVSELSMIP
jgi:nitroimidazol reductase NimA-like FMN-containing flavoprotein (pyridoxamine 5'-phosphate oxidase superfamily)